MEKAKNVTTCGMAAGDQPEYGGYEYDFVEQVPEKFICSAICNNVFRDPHLTDCCGQHFCDSCLQHWCQRQGRKVCPHCRKENFTHILSKPLKREIDELKIYCMNRNSGCEWMRELSNLESHLTSENGCGYVLVDCTNHCKKLMLRKDLADHLTTECLLRNYECQYCGEEDSYQTITTKHYEQCPNYPLDCPKNCGAKGIKRAEISFHPSECPLEPVECPFKEAGCQATLIRKEFDSHLTNNQQQHLLTLMGAFKKTKEELECVRATQQVIATDVGIMQNNKKEQSDLALASIKSQLEMRSFRLKHEGPPLTIRMTDFSLHKANGKVWHSPPFYYGAGYKMQLAVYANGTGNGTGTHVSVVLLLMKGEFDDRLRWPISSPNQLQIVMQKQSKSHQSSSVKIQRRRGKREPSTPTGSPHLSESFPPSPGHRYPASQAKASFKCIIPLTYLQRIPDTESVKLVGKEERFVDHPTVDNFMLLTDSIVLQISVSIDTGYIQ